VDAFVCQPAVRDYQEKVGGFSTAALKKHFVLPCLVAPLRGPELDHPSFLQ